MFIDGDQITVKCIACHKLCLPFNEMLPLPLLLLLIYLQGTKQTERGTSECTEIFLSQTWTMDRRLFSLLVLGVCKSKAKKSTKNGSPASKINDFRYFTFRMRFDFNWPFSASLRFNKPIGSFTRIFGILRQKNRTNSMQWTGASLEKC